MTDAGVVPPGGEDVDAGVMPPGGEDVDAGVMPPGGEDVDAGVMSSSGEDVDAGVMSSSGEDVDAGVMPPGGEDVDAGVMPPGGEYVDAGVMPPGGEDVDAGVMPPGGEDVDAGVMSSSGEDVDAGLGSLFFGSKSRGGTVDGGKSRGKSRGGLSKEDGEHRFTYNMNHRNRGLFIIINNKSFDKTTGNEERPGTDKDRDDLKARFSKLGFDVQIFNNATCADMDTIMTKAAKMDHSDSDSFGCAILSHGDDGVVFGTDGLICIKTLVDPFTGDKCPSLAGKPKLFIIQACRGTHFDHGTVQSDALSEHDQTRRIPVEADFLYAYSTPPGYLSWRRPAGTWFVQALCRVLEKWGEEKDMLWMLTQTNYKVAYEYESRMKEPWKDRKKQVPSLVSQLTKELYFHPKT